MHVPGRLDTILCILYYVAGNYLSWRLEDHSVKAKA